MNLKHLKQMPQLQRFSSSLLPTDYGDYTAHTYRHIDTANDFEGHLACVLGEPDATPLVRIHSECLTGDVLGSKRCDCGAQLQKSLELMSQAGAGVLIYLRGQEGRGIGLVHKLRAYELQDQGLDTVDANLELGFAQDLRSYEEAAEILQDLGIGKIRLMTNNPEKLNLKQHGVEIVERIALEIPPTSENIDYLKTKRDRLGHLLTQLD